MTKNDELKGKKHALNQAKVTQTIERNLIFDFEFSDEIHKDHLKFPFIYFLVQNNLRIISPITSK